MSRYSPRRDAEWLFTVLPASSRHNDAMRDRTICRQDGGSTFHLILNEVTEILQLDGQVHVVDHDFFGHLQDERREMRRELDQANEEIYKRRR